MLEKTKKRSALEVAIDAAKVAERRFPEGDEKTVQQLLPLSIICDLFGWRDAQTLLLEIRDHLVNQASRTAGKPGKVLR
jgi:hypothetical protein